MFYFPTNPCRKTIKAKLIRGLSYVPIFPIFLSKVWMSCSESKMVIAKRNTKKRPGKKDLYMVISIVKIFF